MPMVTFAAFIVETDYAFSIKYVNQAVFKGVVVGWNGARQFPYFHFHQATIRQALVVLLEQIRLHVGIFDNNLAEVKP